MRSVDAERGAVELDAVQRHGVVGFLDRANLNECEILLRADPDIADAAASPRSEASLLHGLVEKFAKHYIRHGRIRRKIADKNTTGFVRQLRIVIHRFSSGSNRIRWSVPIALLSLLLLGRRRAALAATRGPAPAPISATTPPVAVAISISPPRPRPRPRPTVAIAISVSVAIPVSVAVAIPIPVAVSIPVLVTILISPR